MKSRMPNSVLLGFTMINNSGQFTSDLCVDSRTFVQFAMNERFDCSRKIYFDFESFLLCVWVILIAHRAI